MPDKGDGVRVDVPFRHHFNALGPRGEDAGMGVALAVEHPAHEGIALRRHAGQVVLIAHVGPERFGRFAVVGAEADGYAVLKAGLVVGGGEIDAVQEPLFAVKVFFPHAVEGVLADRDHGGGQRDLQIAGAVGKGPAEGALALVALIMLADGTHAELHGHVF